MDRMSSKKRGLSGMGNRNEAMSVKDYRKVFLGEICAGKAPDVLVTVLGSCVGVALYDEANRVGGLAHVMLASSGGGVSSRNIGKYADTAIPEIIRMVVKEGAHPGGIKARISGGATMYGHHTDCGMNIGENNINAVKILLKKNNIPIIGEHVGGVESRTMKFDLKDGSLSVYSGGEKKVDL